MVSTGLDEKFSDVVFAAFSWCKQRNEQMQDHSKYFTGELFTAEQKLTTFSQYAGFFLSKSHFLKKKTAHVAKSWQNVLIILACAKTVIDHNFV